MSRPSFLDRVSPLKQRSKLVDWPFATDEGAPKQVRVRLLGQSDMEAAHFAAREHFASMKAAQRPSPHDMVFVVRERTELVWRAFRDPDHDEPITATADELADQGLDVLAPLYDLWTTSQASFVAERMRSPQAEQKAEVTGE